MLTRGRFLVQCEENKDRNENDVVENQNRIEEPAPGPSTAPDYNMDTFMNMSDHSLKMPTDLETTVSMIVDDSVADPDFQLSSEKHRHHDMTSLSMESVEYEHDFNRLLFLDGKRTSTPIVIAHSTLSESADTASQGRPVPIDEDEPSVEAVVPNYSKAERKATSNRRRKENNMIQRKGKLPINLEPCSGCTNKCAEFDQNMRRDIWNTYWEVEYTERRKWLASCIKSEKVRRRRVQNEGDEATFRKKSSRTYYFQKDGKLFRVCLSFFFKTLGYSSDSVIQELVKATNKAPLFKLVKENRGNKGGKTCDVQLITDHILSFNPAVAHYRRHNAPNMRYMPPGLTINYLFNDFQQKYPKKCSKETYRKVLKDIGISVHTPECDICGDCASYKKNQEDCEEKGEDVKQETKEYYEKHMTKAAEAIQEYKDDKELVEGQQLKVFSMDLLIPHMPKLKEAFFLSRLIAFNETFASLKKNSESNYCMVWHEGLAGSDAPQIINSIIAFLKEERDVENFIIWMDNCCAQNKNWFLYTAMVNTVNSNIVSDNLNSVTFKYLTKGHTHMSADGIHGNIEKQFRKKPVYDFRDLMDVMAKARQNIKVVPVIDFHDWQKKKRQPRKFNDNLKDLALRNIVEVKFLRGKRSLQYKESFLDIGYIDVDFLQARYDISTKPNKKLNPRGINTAKKLGILDNLVKLMPANRQKF